MYVSYNANPEGNKVGDCTVRAISMALNQPWEATYAGVAVEGMRMLDMPSANAVWGSYLRKKRFCEGDNPEHLSRLLHCRGFLSG